MHIFITGGTGFVGNEVIRQLQLQKHEITCLVRPGSEEKLGTREHVTIHHGDVFDADALAAGVAGCDAVIHLVGIIREFPGRGITFDRLHTEATVNVLQASADQGVRRYLQMSANGTRADAATGYHRTKWQAEEAVRNSGLDWTIFRPSLIYGRGGEFVEMMSDLVRRLPIVPVIGDGCYRMQPVSVEQVAMSFVRALEMPETIGQTYHLGGAADYSYDEMLDIFGQALGKKSVSKLHHPLALMKPAVRILQNIPLFPLAADQLAMLLEGNTCDPADWAATFNITPDDFGETLKDCL